MIILYIIIGMAIVTALPRIIPTVIVDKFIFRDWLNRWLHAIPYAALGALIFPGILSVIEGAPHSGLIGGLVAIAIASLSFNVLFVVIGAILTVFLFTL